MNSPLGLRTQKSNKVYISKGSLPVPLVVSCADPYSSIEVCDNTSYVLVVVIHHIDGVLLTEGNDAVVIPLDPLVLLSELLAGGQGGAVIAI